MVIPLYKKGDFKDSSNYRPISLLSTLSKIIERLVKARIFNYLHSINAITTSQFGSQQSKGTHDAIQHLLEHIYKGINQHDAVAAMFCDLSKAFDCVDHRILLAKLECYGFRGTALSWFASYLKGRTQIVVSNGVRSLVLGVQFGVPQRSVLGPILFLI